MPTDPAPGSIPGFAHLRFKAKALAALGLPDIVYPIRTDALGNDGDLPYAEMLFGLQESSRFGTSDWRSFEPAIDRLAELIMPDDLRDTVDVAGDTWWLEIGPVDLCQRVVTIQRENTLVAAICPRADGRLRIACYRPLDAKSADYMMNLALNPHPQHGVCMRENNWEFALDCAAGAGNGYAFDRGEAHLSYWQAGTGIMQDGSIDPDWHQMRNLPVRQPARVAMELGVRYALQ